MKNKAKTIFVCNECGYQVSRWMGKCPDCSAWNSIEEKIAQKKSTSQATLTGPKIEWTKLDDPHIDENRFSSGNAELDRVLGDGIVPGSVIMLGGDPGIGKSTLMLQILAGMRKETVYISGEESKNQIQQRSMRLKLDHSKIAFANETNLEKIVNSISGKKQTVVVIDSIQTIASDEIEGIPGNASQLRYCTSSLVREAKQNGYAVFLIGHVTKDGAIAGPKILEHLVDTVLYFEGESNLDYRIIRSAKNRFGAVNEIAVYRMSDTGLQTVDNPSEIFMNLDSTDRQGTAIAVISEGNRSMLVEIQALVAKTQFGTPQRTASGIDHRRMNLLLAVLEKKASKPFGFHDVFIKTAAGLRIDDPAADLAICMALISSLDEKNSPPNTAFCGEVSLTGEIRKVSNIQSRIIEAEKLGFKQIYIPQYNSLPKYTKIGVKMKKHISELIR